MGDRARVPLTLADGYLPLPELATYSGLSIRTLRRFLHDPKRPLPHYQVDGRVVVQRSEYDGWVRQFRQTGETPEDLIARDLLEAMRR